MISQGIFLICTNIIILLGSCDNMAKRQPEKINSIVVSFDIPILDQNENLVTFSDRISIFFCKNLVLYQVPGATFFSTIITNKEGSITNDSLEKIEKSYKYFVTEKGTSIGKMYDSLNDKTAKSFNVDSFLLSNTVTSFSSFYEQKKNNDSLIVELHGPDNCSVEKYIPKIRPNDSYSDSTILFFDDRFKHIDFSFEKELEKKRKKKLTKVLIVFNPKPESNNKLLRFRREIKFEMKENVIINEKGILNLFLRYK